MTCFVFIFPDLYSLLLRKPHYNFIQKLFYNSSTYFELMEKKVHLS